MTEYRLPRKLRSKERRRNERAPKKNAELRAAKRSTVQRQREVNKELSDRTIALYGTEDTALKWIIASFVALTISLIMWLLPIALISVLVCVFACFAYFNKVREQDQAIRALDTNKEKLKSLERQLGVNSKSEHTAHGQTTAKEYEQSEETPEYRRQTKYQEHLANAFEKAMTLAQ